MTAHLLLGDWGTTALRVWSVDASGCVIGSHDSPRGVGALRKGDAPQVFAGVRAALDAPHAPALLCGMAGSNLGWAPAPYAPCPAGVPDIAERCVAVPDASAPAWILPGLACDGAFGLGDVLRGEETQIVGWLSASPGDALVCLPGTHAKWALVADRRIVRFATAITGELHALLSTAPTMTVEDAGDDDHAFVEGVLAAGEGDALSARLFGVRVRRVLHGRTKGDGAFLSGLLIGAEVAAMTQLFPSSACTVIARPALGRLYAMALAQHGVTADVHDGETLALEGLRTLARCRGLL